MPLIAQDIKPLPAGKHRGIITRCEETKNDFGSGKQKDVVEIEIQADEPKTMPVSMTFSAKLLEGYSGLSRFLAQIGVLHPKPGQPWNPVSIEGTEIEFETANNPKGFAVIVKETIRPAK